MDKKNIRIDSISRFHELIGYEKPKHPLLTLIDYSKIKPLISTKDISITTSFYNISLKNGSSCKTRYGRQYYDFQEASLSFLAPGQTVYISEEFSEEESIGWNLCFHPDLIYNTTLGRRINEYMYFKYNTDEALHLSSQEKQKITGIVNDIENEFSQNIDMFSHELLISYLELFLNHCKRFYGRQFITRTKVNKEAVVKFEKFLECYFDSDELKAQGIPSVRFCAEKMGYSANYLSDLLKKETGKNTLEHIHLHLIEKAKNMLIGTEKSVNVIAYELGFEYPQHFSKLFKNKTGMSPVEYRN